MALWEVFKIDFKSFTLEVLNRVNSIALYRLRSCLQCGGVFIAPTTRTEGSDVRKTIVSTMKDTIKEGIKHKWTEEDVESVRETLEGSDLIFSRALARSGLLKDLAVSYATNCTNITSPTLSASRVNIPSSYPLPNSPPPTTVADTQPQPVLRPTDVAKQISEIARIVTDEQKYDGLNGSFDHKYTIFVDVCRRVGLPEDALARAFPVILKGMALDHFYNNRLAERPLEEACINICGFFEGPGYNRRNLVEWNNTDLMTITSQNPGKSTYENVQLLVNTLRKLQYGLTPALRSTEFL